MIGPFRSPRAAFAGFFLGSLALAVPARAAPAPTHPIDQCQAAVRQAERQMGIAAGLLAAIAKVESGWRDPETGRTGPWPWTVGAEGQGRQFPTREEAVAHVQELQARGVQLIDVGCLQVNLHHHPNAFASLEEAFDPAANARYAARFLKELQGTRQDWMLSASHYHSQTPGRAEVYRERIAAAWPLAQRRAADPRGLLAEAWAKTRPASREMVTITPGSITATRMALPKPGWTGMRMLATRNAAPPARGRPRVEVAEAR